LWVVRVSAGSGLSAPVQILMIAEADRVYAVKSIAPVSLVVLALVVDLVLRQMSVVGVRG